MKKFLPIPAVFLAAASVVAFILFKRRQNHA